MFFLSVPNPGGGLVFSSIAFAVILLLAVLAYFFPEKLYYCIGRFKEITGSIRKWLKGL